MLNIKKEYLHMKTLKERLRACEPVAGMHVALTDPCVSELCGMVGFDFLWIDTEHTAIDYSILQNHLIGARAARVPALVRIPWNDPILAKRVLEQGPEGIIFPVINTAEELDLAMKSTLYPPEGTRGFGPQRASRYCMMDMDDCIREQNQHMVRMVQLESKTAIHNLPEMVKNPYVDGFIFGACDLSGSIGELNRVFDPHTSELIDEGIRILKAAGKTAGISTGSNDPRVLQYWHDKGMNFISAGTDYCLIASGAQAVLSTLRSLQAE